MYTHRPSAFPSRGCRCLSVLSERRSPCAEGCGGRGAIGEAVTVDMNVGPSCVSLNSMGFGAVLLVLLDRLGELKPADQIILNIDAES